MPEGPILHIFGWDKKFVPPYIAFVRENFNASGHEFMIYGGVSRMEMESLGKVFYCRSILRNIPMLSRHLRNARKVVIHGLFSIHLCYILILHAWLLHKCYWAIWGGDLYAHINSKVKGWRWVRDEYCRRFVMSRIGNLITCIKGDVDLAEKWYGAKGKMWECFLYTTNIYRAHDNLRTKTSETINILIGNSADPSNNQQEILEKLSPYRDRNIVVYAILSYGNPVHAEFIRKLGKGKFGDKFKSVDSFMPLNEYLNFLSKIDVAIFNHNRQQAMGNTINLLGQGKKVFVRSDTTQWPFFIGMGVTLFDSKNINLDAALNSDTSHNREIIAEHFSYKKLRDQYKAIFA